MNVAIVTYTLFFGYGEKHRETIFEVSNNESKQVLQLCKGGWGFCLSIQHLFRKKQ